MQPTFTDTFVSLMGINGGEVETEEMGKVAILFNTWESAAHFIFATDRDHAFCERMYDTVWVDLFNPNTPQELRYYLRLKTGF